MALRVELLMMRSPCAEESHMTPPPAKKEIQLKNRKISTKGSRVKGSDSRLNASNIGDINATFHTSIIDWLRFFAERA